MLNFITESVVFDLQEHLIIFPPKARHSLTIATAEIVTAIVIPTTRRMNVKYTERQEFFILFFSCSCEPFDSLDSAEEQSFN